MALEEPVVAASEQDVHAAQLARKNAAKVESASKLLEKATADPKVIKQLKKPRGKGKAKAKAQAVSDSAPLSGSLPAPGNTEGNAADVQGPAGEDAEGCKGNVSYESEWKACETWLYCCAFLYKNRSGQLKHFVTSISEEAEIRAAGIAVPDDIVSRKSFTLRAPESTMATGTIGILLLS